MQIKFKVKTAELTSALDTVSIVSPRPVVPNKNETAGFLFMVRGEKCYVYSRDALQAVRADFPIYDVEGEGAFIYPAQHASAFKALGEEIEFEVVNDGDTHTVKYKGGSSAERTSLDPALLSTCDKDLDSAPEGQTFSVALLREALGLAKPFIAKADDQRTDEQWKMTQIFDSTQEATAKGNGHLYASDSKQAFYFYCEAFKDKGFAIHGKHLGVLGSFLAKCEGTVTVRKGANMMFVIDAAGRVLGWAHQTKSFSKFIYYPLKADQIVLVVPVETVLRALSYIKAELPAKTDWIKVNFDAKNATLMFSASDDKCKASSFPVVVGVQQNTDDRDFSYGVSLGNFRNLFDGVKGKQVELRASIQAPGPNRPKEIAMFRTIDNFWLDSMGKNVAGSGANKDELPEGAVQCIATRFMPSMN